MNLYKHLTDNFHRWEMRGRGVLTFPAAVELEPPFVPFPGHQVSFPGLSDGGTTPTLLSKLAGGVVRALRPPAAGAAAMRTPEPDEEDPEPEWAEERGEPPIEFRVKLPPAISYAPEAIAHFLATISLFSGSVALEVIGTSQEIWVQIVSATEDAEVLARQLEAQFPDAKRDWSEENLTEVWLNDEESERVVIDFGLSREFMLPLVSGTRIDPFVSLIGAIARLEEKETAVYQVIFSPLSAPWGEHAMAAVTKRDGKPFFDDGADLVKGAMEKMSHPLYGVVLRLAAKAPTLVRTWAIIRGMASTLRLFSREGGQSLMPLTNEDYDDEAHCEDLLLRRSRRCGMVLTVDELVGLAHWPTAAVKSEKLVRVTEDRSRAAPSPPDSTGEPGTVILGINEHEGDESPVVLTVTQRLQHMHIIGGSGMGKTTLLLSMMLQDLESGQGFALLDPEGDLTQRVLASVPPGRVSEVVLIDPSDEEYVTPFNVLSAHSDHEKALLASDLVSVFRRLSTSWGDRMGIIFQNLVLAFLEHREGGTLRDMERFLINADWRESFLEGVDDPDVRFYWRETFPRLDGPKSVGPILTRLEALLTPKVIKYMVSQRENLIDFGEIMDQGRILLVKLPKGQIGEEVAHLLGSLIMVKLQQMAMSRARMPAKDRKPFFCYVDECQHFVTPSMAAILAGARKYGLGLVLAHQHLQQLLQSGDVAAAVMANAATRVIFQVSDADGRALAGGFAHYDQKDFSGLAVGHALCRIGTADHDFNLRVIRPDEPDETEADERRREAIDASRDRYTLPRKEVEEIYRRVAAAEERKSGRKPEKKPGKAEILDKKTADQDRPEAVGSPSGAAAVAERTDQGAGVTKPSLPPPTPPPVNSATPIVLPPQPEGAASPVRPSGMGRGGDDHQLVVGRIATEGGNLGYKSTKEATVAGGRVDVALESRERRIAVEVAVSSNTAHEIENLTKCLGTGFDFVVSVSPLANVRENIERAARKAFGEDALARLRFMSPDALLAWLAELAETDAKATAPPVDQPLTIGGRRVRVRHTEVSPEERRRIEVEQLEVIADLVNKNRTTQPDD